MDGWARPAQSCMTARTRTSITSSQSERRARGKELRGGPPRPRSRSQDSALRPGKSALGKAAALAQPITSCCKCADPAAIDGANSAQSDCNNELYCCGGLPRGRRYKAYFRWSHYPYKLKAGTNLLVETDACASVTAAFLQVCASGTFQTLRTGRFAHHRQQN